MTKNQKEGREAREGGGGQKGAVQDVLRRRWRAGAAGLGSGLVLALISGGSAGSTWLTCFSRFPREVFEPAVERGELVVRYRARKSYSRRTTEATCK